MEIIKRPSGDRLELIIKGRLDAYWADHLTKALREVIREGTHHLTLNLAEVVYLSSAGIRVLLQVQKQLREIQGSLTVSNPSEQVKAVLGLVGLESLLLSQSVSPSAALPKPAVALRLDRERVTFEIFDREPGASLTCRTIGHPELLLGCRFGEQDCHTVSFPESTFAVGLGAFGKDFEDCRGRFGEFLAVAGTAAYLPTDGTNVPDYSVSAGAFVPSLQVLYSLACEGTFAHLLRYESTQGARSVTLTELAESCLEVAGTDVVGVVMAAESAGLIGAALKRSPALHGFGSAPFQHPEIREWLSFTTERTHAHGVTLMVGVAARTEGGALAPLLRPLGAGPSPVGHFHAATFSYRPLKKGEIDLRTTVSTLFEVETLHSILHLLNDHREIAGTRDNEFVRGACWISPVRKVVGAQK